MTKIVKSVLSRMWENFMENSRMQAELNKDNPFYFYEF